MKCPKCNFLNNKQNRNCSQCGEFLGFTMPIKSSPLPAINPADFLLDPGESFGSRYQIIEQIGAGGMGKVFKALDRELNILVVLKIINPEMSNSPDVVERFKRELLLAREIQHENVIRIYDLGEINGVRYISMNYAEGQNLLELIGMAGALSVEKVLDVISKICQALIAAHGKGIIHRDLKPQNVMIGKKGMVTVLDFGIARSMSQAGTTQTGMVIGTPECMSPEQIQGEEIDVSTDIYAVGVMMFQMVTGRLPFLADSTSDLLLKHLHETPLPPSSLNPMVPPALERIILKCLEKNPGKRYASAEKLLQSVKRLINKKARQESRKRHLLSLRRSLRLKPLIYLGRLLELLIILFALGTLVGWFLDYRFGNKLQQFTMEYPLYFKTHFPMDKDYLPADWPARQGNAWEVYQRVMDAQDVPRSGTERHLSREIGNLYRTAITPANLETVKGILENTGAKMEMDKIISGIAFGTLVPRPGEPLLPAFVATFSRWQALQARLGFLSGDIAGGVDRLRELGYFLLDCEAAAGGMVDHAQATGQFSVFCQELVPLVLANDIDPARKQLEKIEPLLLLFLKKISGQRFFQMAYMDDLRTVRQGNFKESWWTGPSYFWFGRFRFLAKMSSRNMSLFKTLANESRARDEMGSIADPVKMRKLLDRFRHDDGKDWPLWGSSRFYRLQNAFLAGRAMVKLALLLERQQRFGMNGVEMTALLNSDLGINDLTGEPWNITCEAGNNVVHLTERVEFEIKPVSYSADHAAIIAEWQRIAAAIGAANDPRLMNMDK
jgi:serine/threonine protein kinase